MKTLNVAKIDHISQLADIEPQQIACNNWPEYPASPLTTFRIARLGDNIVIEFRVEEDNPRAVNTADQEPVWQDSCVEFFARPAGGDHYCNFEFNSRGCCVSSRRKGRKEDVVKLTPEQLARIKRTPSVHPGYWTLLVEIPIDLFAPKDNVDAIEANLYKCGDLTDAPHYLSWAPIDLPKPDFHCPAYFGQLQLS